MRLKLLTIKDMTEMLNVERTTIYRWIKNKGLPAIKIDGALRFKENEVKEWVDNNGKKVGD